MLTELVAALRGDEGARGRRRPAGAHRAPRATLNLGHTLAHALESVGGYELLHGEAVAVGLVFAGALAGALERIDADAVDRYRDVVSRPRPADRGARRPPTATRSSRRCGATRRRSAGSPSCSRARSGSRPSHDPDPRALDVAFAAVGVGG